MITSYTVILEENPQTGDLIMPIPVEVLNQMGWDFGDILEWQDANNGSWYLTKKVIND